MAFVASCLLSLSASLRAAPAEMALNSLPDSLKDYQSSLPTVQQMLELACANQQIDAGRATIAYSTFARSNTIMGELQSDITQNTRFLGDPSSSVQAEFQAKAQKERARAQATLSQASDRFEYDQHLFQTGKLDGAALKQDQQRLARAKSLSNSAGQLPSADELAQVVQARTNASVNSLKMLQEAAQKMAVTSSRAQGCYTTATGTGSYANPAFDSGFGASQSTASASSAQQKTPVAAAGIPTTATGAQ